MANLSERFRRGYGVAGGALGLLVAGRGEILFQREDVHAAASVAGDDAVVIGAGAAARVRVAMECGDELTSVQVPDLQRVVPERGHPPLAIRRHRHTMDWASVAFQRA